MLKTNYIISPLVVLCFALSSCGSDTKSDEKNESEEKISNEASGPNLKPEYSEGCKGDFEGLITDIKSTFLNPISSNSIALRKTSKDTVMMFVQGEQSVEKEYDGIRFNGYISFEDDQLIQIRYDYIYECPSAKEGLNLNQSSIYETCVNLLGKEIELTGEDYTRSYFWSINDQDIILSNYDDGFSLVAKKDAPLDTTLISNQ